MDRLAIDNGPPVSPGSAESPSDDVLRDRPVMSPENQPFVLAQEYPRVVRVAQPRRRFDQRIEHRFEVEGRAADQLEHVGGGGLLLQRQRKVLSCLREFAGPLVEFPLEIPRGTAIALGLRRIAALAVSRFNRLAACFGASAHCLPQGSGQSIVPGQTRTPEVAMNVRFGSKAVRVAGGSTNELADILCGWFGKEAGTPGRSDRVRFHKRADTIVMEPFSPSLKSGCGPKLWERYLREKIPPEFGLSFSQATWNAGFIVNQPHLFLLVTLAKEDINPNHRYSDHFTSEQEFSW